MTTIAASLEVMAADSKVITAEDTHYQTAKMLRGHDWIAGAAGAGEWPTRFLEWCQAGRPKKLPPQRGCDLGALFLCEKGLFVYLDSFKGERVKSPFWAVGSGAKAAIAIFYEQIARKEPLDPVHAVKIACLADAYSGPPVDFLRLKKRTP